MRGAFAGLSLGTTTADLSRAVVEASCFAFLDIVRRMEELGLGEQIRVVGGGARVPFWTQVKASVCGRPVQRVLTEDASLMGAAVLGAVAAGCYPDIDAAVAALIRPCEAAVEPEPAQADRYADAYHEYRRLFAAIDGMTGGSDRAS
jgi:xylulokinase